VMNVDGSAIQELTSAHGFHSFPAWSPDASQIAYVAFDGTNANIYVMNADGSDSHQVTEDPAHEDAPTWSPDGRLIAFTSEGGSRDPGIYTISPDGSGVTELAHDPDPANLGIAWSPDGAELALVSIRGQGNDRNVYVLDVATGEVSAVGDPGAYFGVSWQPLTSDSNVPSPVESVPTSGYWIRFPDTPTTTDAGMEVIAVTNLPEGTLYLVNTPRSGACCIAVHDGRIDISMNDVGQLDTSQANGCTALREGNLVRAPDLHIQITVDRHIEDHIIGTPVTLNGNSPSPDASTQQPASVVAILGNDFENLSGDQVTTGPDGNRLTATVDYPWPTPRC
jgi:WD40-like Beta Propeller Repeat